MSNIVAAVAMIALAVVVSAILTAIPLYLVWNWLCPELFGLPTVSLVQAFGLAFLVNLLFKSSSSSS